MDFGDPPWLHRTISGKVAGWQSAPLLLSTDPRKGGCPRGWAAASRGIAWAPQVAGFGAPAKLTPPFSKKDNGSSKFIGFIWFDIFGTQFQHISTTPSMFEGGGKWLKPEIGSCLAFSSSKPSIWGSTCLDPYQFVPSIHTRKTT